MGDRGSQAKTKLWFVVRENLACRFIFVFALRYALGTQSASKKSSIYHVSVTSDGRPVLYTGSLLGGPAGSLEKYVGAMDCDEVLRYCEAQNSSY